MSDGIYELESEMLGVGSVVKVRSGYFEGKSDRLSFSGNFSVNNKILRGEISIRDRVTGQEEVSKLFAEIVDDENFLMKVLVQGNEISVGFRKEKLRPFSK